MLSVWGVVIHHGAKLPLDLKRIVKTGGHGDRIMATNQDPTKPWYYLDVTSERATFNPDFRPTRGTVVVHHKYQFKRKYLLVNPHVKQRFSADNRQWPLDRWQELVDRLDIPVAECGPPGTDFLRGVHRIETPTFEHAVGVLSACHGMVSSEGGMMHAAAALNKPAVIIWGAWSSPDVMGYDDHVHIAEPDPEGLGWRKSHPRCKAAMERISVDRVLEGIKKIWN